MSRESVLSRQILTYMLTLALMIIAIAILGSWLFYSFVLDYLPGGVAAGNDENMTMWDWMWIVTVSAISVLISLFLTVNVIAHPHAIKRGCHKPETHLAGRAGCQGLVRQFPAWRDKSSRQRLQRNG